MEGIVITALLTLIGGGLAGALFSNRRSQKRGESHWRQAAQVLGLQHTATTGGGTLGGRMQGLEVTARGGVLGSGDNQRWATEVEVSGGISHALRRDLFGKLNVAAILRAEEALRADLQHAMAAAILNRSLRGSIDASIAELDAQIVDGVVRVRRDGPIGSATAIVELVRAVVGLARSISTEGLDVPEQLRANMESEVMPDVRDQMHRLLLRCYPDTPAGQHAMELAASARDPAIRLLRAQQLEEGKLEALQVLAESRAVRSSYRIDAIEELETLDDSRVAVVLRRLLRDGDRDVRRAAIRVAVRARRGELIDALADAAADTDDATALELAAAFAELGEPRAEAALIGYLQRDAPELRGAAIDALARIGSVKAVPPLLKLAEAGEREARAAVDAIQARLGDPEAGQLTLVAPPEDAGELALATESGDLSLARGDDDADEKPPR